MNSQFSRSEILLGVEAINKLNSSHVAVFGVGGVGGYVVEALARAGIGGVDLIDNDEVCLSNLNRQIIALHSTLGKYKVDVARERCLDINPEIKVNTFKMFYSYENASEFDFRKYDYIVDAIDTISSKILLIENAKKYGIPIISAMGAGNKLNATDFKVADIAKTKGCPLAKIIRKELRKRNIEHLKVVYSEEKRILPIMVDVNQEERVIGSVSYVPSVVGLIMAGEIIKDICEVEKGL